MSNQCGPGEGGLLSGRARGVALVAAVLLILLGAAAIGAWVRRPTPAVPAAGTEPACTAELRSWIVAGRARHLYLQIQAPRDHPELAARIEFTAVSLRRDYRVTSDTGGVPRVGRMTPGRPLGPTSLAPPPDNRVEARYELTLEQARNIQRDRVFEAPYQLLGTNSNAALRRAMESCGLGLPASVLQGGGLFGEFPGIDQDPGAELPPEEWARFGVNAEAPGSGT